METLDPIRFVLAFLFVLGLIGILAFVLKRYGKYQPMLGMKQENGRLDVVEMRWIDPKRKLVLVKRDDAEHLLLLAEGRETVIETNVKNPDA